MIDSYDSPFVTMCEEKESSLVESFVMSKEVDESFTMSKEVNESPGTPTEIIPETTPGKIIPIEEQTLSRIHLSFI